MEKYIMFHGSHDDFEKFDITKINAKSVSYGGAGGDVFGHYFFGYNTNSDTTTEELLKFIKPRLYGYISKQKQYTEGFIYGSEIYLEKEQILMFDKLTLTVDIVNKILSNFKYNVTQEYLSQFENDSQLYKTLCHHIGYIEIANAFTNENKLAFVNCDNFGTLVIINDMIKITNKKYVNLKDESKNQIIF